MIGDKISPFAGFLQQKRRSFDHSLTAGGESDRWRCPSPRRSWRCSVSERCGAAGDARPRKTRGSCSYDGLSMANFQLLPVGAFSRTICWLWHGGEGSTQGCCMEPRVLTTSSTAWILTERYRGRLRRCGRVFRGFSGWLLFSCDRRNRQLLDTGLAERLCLGQAGGRLSCLDRRAWPSY